MFFVGASGQLITLILTVCLPFIFILSGHQEIDTQQSTLTFNIHQNLQEFSSINFNFYDYTLDFSAEIQNNRIEIENSDFIKIPYNKFRVKWKSFCLNNYGNKAPPTFLCFYC